MEKRMRFIVGERVQEVRYPPVIQEEEWNKLSKLSGLPNEARRLLDEYIGYYRELKLDAHKKYGERWYDALCETRDTETQAIKKLEALLSKENFFDALAIGLDAQQKIFPKETEVIRDWLMQSLKEKRKLLEWYGKAMTRVHYYGRTGIKTGRTSLLGLVRDLNDVLKQYTGDRITTGKKRKDGRDIFQCVWYICLIADPELASKGDRGRSTVKKAIEKVLEDYLALDHPLDIEGWVQVMPNAVEAESLSIHDHELGVEAKFEKTDSGGYHWVVNSDPEMRDKGPILCPIVPFVFK
jgi:hypothetical protein